MDEPGGYKALVFDQSDRITEPISAADVADICLRALHEGSARNKVRAAERILRGIKGLISRGAYTAVVVGICLCAQGQRVPQGTCC